MSKAYPLTSVQIRQKGRGVIVTVERRGRPPRRYRTCEMSDAAFFALGRALYRIGSPSVMFADDILVTWYPPR